MRRLLASATAALLLAGCGETPAGPELDELPVPAPAFDIHESPTAGNLEDAAEAYDQIASNTFARHTAGTEDGDRHYMRTVVTDYNEKNFTAELVFTLSNLAGDGATIHFFGMGPGVRTQLGNNEPSGIFFRIRSPDQGGGVDVAFATADGTPTGFWSEIGNITTTQGKHRAIITKTGNDALFEIDASNDGGVDFSGTLSDIATATGETLDDTNSRIYFGTSTQDEFSLSIETASNDTDGDGVPDSEDAFPESDLRPTVVIGSCDSGVANQVLADGATFMDLIGAAAEDARNHGQFVSAVTRLADQWKKDALISGRDQGKITSCAARSR